MARGCIPRATDDIPFDQDALEQEGQLRAQQIRRDQIRGNMQAEYEDRAMRIFVKDAQDVMRKSAATCDGERYRVLPANYGRQRQHLHKKMPSAPPTARQGRPGDEPCEILQPSIRVRQWTRQLHRLHTPIQPMHAAEAREDPARRGKRQELRNAILHSAGFTLGPFHWLHDELGWFVAVCQRAP